MLSVSLHGCIGGHIDMLFHCLPGWLTGCFTFQCVQMKTWRSMCWKTTQLCSTMFKCKCPVDTEDETPGWNIQAVKIEAEDLDLDPSIAHWAVRWSVPVPGAGTSSAPSVAAGSTAAVGRSNSWSRWGDSEEGCSGHYAEADGCIGEDLPAPQPGAREVQDMPYVVLAVGREDTRCPICHLVFKTPYWLRKHMDVHRGGAIPLWQLLKAAGQLPHVKRSPERLHPGVQVHLWGVWSGICDETGVETACKSHSWSLISLHPMRFSSVHIVLSSTRSRNPWESTATTCSQNPAKKGPFFCRVEGCKSLWSSLQ